MTNIRLMSLRALLGEKKTNVVVNPDLTCFVVAIKVIGLRKQLVMIRKANNLRQKTIPYSEPRC